MAEVRTTTQKITPFLWFESEAEAAMNLYISLFPDSKVLQVQRNGDQVITGSFQLAGQQFMALNGGPQFTFTEAISLFVICEDQAEVDRLWNALTTDGGAESRCGWLKDRFGVSWQIIPTALPQLLGDSDPGRAQRAMQAMLGMQKIDIAELRRAADAA